MPPRYQTRRATTDDLAQLEALWREARFPDVDLARHFTEFQVAIDEHGAVAAAIGLRMSGAEGWIHSETFADFGLTDLLRPRLWERLQVVAETNRLHRLWTRETAPFWRKETGFAEAPRESLDKLPAEFGPADPGWLLLRLREEGADPVELDKQFQLFKQEEAARREKILARATALRWFGTLIAVAIFIFVLCLMFHYVHQTRR